MAVKPDAQRLLNAIEVMLTGSNFRGPAKAVLAAEDNEAIPAVTVDAIVSNPSSASAIFTNPASHPANAGTTWTISVINHDETQSNSIEVLRVPR